MPSNSAAILSLKNIGTNTRRGIRRALFKVGHEHVVNTQKLIRKGPKTGRLYRIPGRLRRHRASAPGEAPANLTGNLARNVGFQIRGESEMSFGDRAKYGLFLERGTRKMEPRPHLITSINVLSRNTRNHLEHEVRVILVIGK